MTRWLGRRSVCPSFHGPIRNQHGPGGVLYTLQFSGSLWVILYKPKVVSNVFRAKRTAHAQVMGASSSPRIDRSPRDIVLAGSFHISIAIVRLQRRSTTPPPAMPNKKRRQQFGVPIGTAPEPDQVKMTTSRVPSFVSSSTFAPDFFSVIR